MLKTAYDISEAMELHKPHEGGWSGYPGARWLFNSYLDDKESLEYLMMQAKYLKRKELSDSHQSKWLDEAILKGKRYRDELVKRIKDILEPNDKEWPII